MQLSLIEVVMILDSNVKNDVGPIKTRNPKPESKFKISLRP